MQEENANDHAAEIKLDENFWNGQYIANTTRWDMGEVSPPLKAYIDQLTGKDLRILIPGCGNTYEASYLLEQGFTNVTVIDIAPVLVANLQQKFADNRNINIILGDFFEHQGQYDLVLEQTFFCALDPSLRKNYVTKMHELLAVNGKLAGVMFSTDFDEQGPPFGGSKAAYEQLFAKWFDIKTMEPCFNSISRRAGNELFVIFVKKPGITTA